MSENGYFTVIRKDGEGFKAFILGLDFLHVRGRTVEETKKTAQEAVALVVSDARARGEDLPEPGGKPSEGDGEIIFIEI